MLAAVVVHLQALASGQVEGGFVRAVHALWHDHLSKSAPDVADSIAHQAQVKPFTLTDLMGPRVDRSGRIQVQTGDSAWFRVTSLTPVLSAALMEKWLPGLVGQTKTLAGVPWAVLAYSTTRSQHLWAGQDSYESIVARTHDHSPPDDRWELIFGSPTAFHASKQTHLPFPLPGSLVTSWLRRWQTYDDTGRQWTAPPHWRHSLVVSGYNLHTVPLRQGPKLTIGCLGWYAFRAHHLAPDELSMISALADYAFYCGSGHQTTQGMGLTRRQQP